MRFLLAFIFLSLTAHPAQLYQVDWVKDSAITAASLGTVVTSYARGDRR